MTPLGPVALTSSPVNQIPVFTVTPPSSCSSADGSVKITWNFGSGTRIRAWDMHGGIRFDDVLVSGSSAQLNSGNSFQSTISGLRPGIYTFGVYRDPFDDNLTTNNSGGGNVDDYTFSGSNTYTSDQQRAGVYGVVLLPTSNNITTLSATAAAATDCLTSDGSITISGLVNATAYNFSYLVGATSFPLTKNASGGTSYTITGLYPGIYPVRIRVNGETSYRLINVEVPVLNGVKCYSGNVTCDYSVGTNFVTGGDFGTASGALPVNGTTDYSSVAFSNSNPQDSKYSLVKSSYFPDNSITSNPNWLLRNFDFTGRTTHLWGAMQATKDHTGSATSSDGTTNGYFMMVNANYPQNRVVNITSVNLQACREYEFSCWVKNIQPYFPRNKNNSSNANNTYQPIIPRLGLVVNGIIYDFQSTGANVQPADIQTRTRLNDMSWIKLGVRFKAPANVSSSSISIYNFQQGGYGNDFAVDDVSLKEVINPIYLTGSAVGPCGPGQSLTATASSSCPQFGQPTYQWQVSTDNGASFSNTGSSFTTLPATLTATSTTSNLRYRVTITDGSCVLQTPAYRFNSFPDLCVLPSVNLSLWGVSKQGMNEVEWEMGNTSGVERYEVEGSTDGRQFRLLKLVDAVTANHYKYVDAINLYQSFFYRVKIVYNDGRIEYSTLLKLDANNAGSLLKVEVFPNPVLSLANLVIKAPANGSVALTIYDVQNRMLRMMKQQVKYGSNAVVVSSFKDLPGGIYFIRAEMGNEHAIVKVTVVK